MKLRIPTTIPIQTVVGYCAFNVVKTAERIRTTSDHVLGDLRNEKFMFVIIVFGL